MSKAERDVSDQASVLESVRKSGTQKVKVAVADIDGVLRGKYIHIDKFHSAVEGGFGFCNVVFGWDMNDQTYDNTKLTGWHHGYPIRNGLPARRTRFRSPEIRRAVRSVVYDKTPMTASMRFFIVFASNGLMM